MRKRIRSLIIVNCVVMCLFIHLFLPGNTSAGRNITPILKILILKQKVDCNGDQGGNAYIDYCGVCVGGNTGQTSYVLQAGEACSAGQVWMDRNLGASRVALSFDDEEAYGDLYQWGRDTDGHEKRNSPTTTTLSINSDTPGHGRFILAPNSLYDWRTPQSNNLWQGEAGINNPCPAGFRLPTETELNAERLSWSTNNNAAGAYASPLKLVVAGYRYHYNGTIGYTGSGGDYWSATVYGSFSRYLYVFSSGAGMHSFYRAYGLSVRCLKD